MCHSDCAKKACSSCGIEKPLAEFQKRAASKDGMTSSCKSCLRERDAEKHRKFRAKRLESMRNYTKTEAAKMSHAESVTKWRLSNRDRQRAHSAIGHALAKGQLKKLPCAICGSEKVEAHHPSYSAPLDVVWLCSEHHKQIHTEIRNKEYGKRNHCN